jgi:hypothetical protein
MVLKSTLEIVRNNIVSSVDHSMGLWAVVSLGKDDISLDKKLSWRK